MKKGCDGMTRVSVVVPAYNAEQTVCQAVQSLLQQTYENVEIIVVNDGSQDRTAEKLTQFGDKIRVISKENGGVSSARNRGMAEATGEYLMFADADDLCRADMVESAVGRLETAWVDYVIAGVTKVKETGRFDDLYGNRVYRSPNAIRKNIGAILSAGLNGPVSKLYRLDLIRKHGLLFDESLPLGEDLNFNLEYLLCVDSVAYLDKSLYEYQLFNSTATTAYRADMYQRRMLSLNKMNETFRLHGLENPVDAQMRLKFLYALVFNLRHRDCPDTKEEKCAKIRAAKQAYFAQPRKKLGGIFRILEWLAHILPAGGLYALAGMMQGMMKLLPEKIRGVSV